MKTKNNIRLGLAGLAACLLAGSIVAAKDTPRRAAMRGFMRQKLVYSQGILEGMALEKFDLISKNAVRMRDMSQSNTWFVIKQAAYMEHTTNYQKNVDALYLAAIDKNLDEATQAYTKVARNCVECHRLVRLEQRKQADQPVKPKITPGPAPF